MAAEEVKMSDSGKEGKDLLGSPTFEKLENGRFKCVESGHELPHHAIDSYSNSKRCRLGLIDFALSNNKPPLNIFTQDPLCRSKVICKLTGDTVNKSEEHIWKHINGKRFLNKLEQVEAGTLPKDGTGKVEEKQDKQNENGIEKKNKHKKKKNKKKKDKGMEEIISEVRETSNDSDLEEAEFWMPPDGQRWDFDDGGDRWASDSESGQEDEDEDDHVTGTADDEENNNASAELSKRAKRMTIEVGPSSFASRKKKRMSRAVHKKARTVRTTQNPAMNPVRCATTDIETEFTAQCTRTHQSTRWYQEETGREIYMHEAIVEAFEYIHASSLLTLNHPSYEALTSELLASLTTTIQKPGDNGTITFYLGNIQRVLNLQQWNDIFGFANSPDEFRVKVYPLKRFWGRVTGSPTLPSTALPGKEIASPLFRVILKILGNSIWARKETSRPIQKELACLYMMLYNPRYKMNLGHEFLLHLLTYKKQTGELCMGGMITQIALHLGVDLSAYSSQPPTHIDRQYLILSRVLELKNNRLQSKCDGRYTPLAAPLMDLLHVPNWYDVWAGCRLHPDLRPGRMDKDSGDLRTRDPHYHVEAPGADAPTDEEEYEDYEGMDTGPSHPRASSSGTAQEYPAYYTDICNRIDGLKTEVGNLRQSQRTYHEEQSRLAEERWKEQQDFMTFVRQHPHFAPLEEPGPNGTPPSYW